MTESLWLLRVDIFCGAEQFAGPKLTKFNAQDIVYLVTVLYNTVYFCMEIT